ncbi:MAG: SBBP repeat-containing protein [Candidatus Bathyarchaeia archaeon]
MAHCNLRTALVLALVLLAVVSGTLSATPPPLVQACTTCNFLLTWGILGSGNGQFNWPNGIAVDSSGNVYVTELNNNRVQKFMSNSTFITSWGGKFSVFGAILSGVAVDGSSNVYVTDSSNNVVDKFDSTGGYTSDLGSPGSGNGQFNYPYGVAVDGSGNVYVVDNGNNRVEKFTNTGTYVTKWGSTGSSIGQFKSPMGIAVDGSGNVFVTDNGNDRVEKFTNTGTYVTQWGSSGSGSGQFHGPIGVAVDGYGNVYVADSGNNRVEKFTNTGTYVTQWGSSGSGNGQFKNPYGVAVDSSGNVYVTDYLNNRVEKFGAPVGAASVSILLVLGWNLISLPVVPVDNAIATILGDLISGNDVMVVWSYQGGAWKSFRPGTTIGTLTTMQDGFGYWIYMTHRRTLVVSGFVIPPGSLPTSYQLASGWNCLGFKPQPALKNETIGTYLTSIRELSTAILLYDNLNSTWIWASTDTQLAPGEAIWIDMNLAVTFTPPWVT